MQDKINYSSTGVNYKVIDPFKKLAQQAAKQTSQNLVNFGLKEVETSRGESAYVWEEDDAFRALVIEGLGTKNLVADKVSEITGKTYYDAIAQDSVAAIVNDIITVGALPQVVNAYFGVGGPDWFANSERSSALVEGWAKACNMAGCTWGGGETPGLTGIINPQTVDLVGSCIGVIKPKENIVLGDNLTAGDIILLIESSGIHTNGLSLARAVAEKIPDGYQATLSDGTMYGEALLTPSHIYVNLIKDLQKEQVNIHYMCNITGHGFRKLMRANRDFTYQINKVPQIPAIFDFIQQQSKNSDEEMYGNFNMGAGFAIFLPADQVDMALKIIEKNKFKSWNAGIVKTGPKQVELQPKNIIFGQDSLDLR